MQNVQTAKPTVKQRLIAAAVVGSSVAVCASANAAIDTSGVTAAITDGASAAGVVGAAALIFIAGIKIFNKIRGAV